MSRSKAIAKPLTERTNVELHKLATEGDRAAAKMLLDRRETEGTAEVIIESLTGNAFRVRDINHSNGIIFEAFRRKMKQMREDLGVKTGTPLEKLLIERVVMCWYHLHQTELAYVARMKESASLNSATFHQKSLDRAEARYQAAVKSLATVRRLQIPAVQVNIGEKQINIVQAGTEQANAVLTGERAEGAPATPII